MKTFVGEKIQIKNQIRSKSNKQNIRKRKKIAKANCLF
jgi:hypothetical protein